MNNHDILKRVCAGALSALLAGALAGCASSDPQASPTATATATAPAVPQVTAAPGKVAAPQVQRFHGYEARLKPVKGPRSQLSEPIAAQLMLDASVTQRLNVPNAVAKFGNDIEVYDPNSDASYHFQIASDGQLLMRADDGHVFRMPEYIYYLLEQRLWEVGGTLKEGTITWQPESGSTELLETELPRLIKTAMLPAYGYAMGYFCSYKIYGLNTSNKDSVKIYMLLMYMGYDIDDTKGAAFLPEFSHVSAASLTFKRLRGNTWQLAELRLPVTPKEVNKDTTYASVRKVLPFEHMDAYEADIKDTSALTKDIVRQATEFLRENGLTGLSIGD